MVKPWGGLSLAVSYVSQGIAFLIVGIFLLIFPIAGIVVIILSVQQIVRGQSQITPGSKPEWCKWNGHDWRRDVMGHKGEKVCRNCLKGANVNYGTPGGSIYGAGGMPATYAAPAGPGYAPQFSYSTQATPAAPVATPTPTIVAPTPAVATSSGSSQQYCKECGLAVGPADATCPHCGKPPR